jgi:hypothetical protein
VQAEQLVQHILVQNGEATEETRYFLLLELLPLVVVVVELVNYRIVLGLVKMVVPVAAPVTKAELGLLVQEPPVKVIMAELDTTVAQVQLVEVEVEQAVPAVQPVLALVVQPATV